MACSSSPLIAQWRENTDFVYLIATVLGRHSGDQVHTVKKAAAPSFFILLAGDANGMFFDAVHGMYAQPQRQRLSVRNGGASTWVC